VSGTTTEPLGGWKLALVGEIVGAAGEAVDDRDRPAQPRGQQPRGDREVLVMIDGHGTV